MQVCFCTWSSQAFVFILTVMDSGAQSWLSLPACVHIQYVCTSLKLKKNKLTLLARRSNSNTAADWSDAAGPSPKTTASTGGGVSWTAWAEQSVLVWELRLSGTGRKTVVNNFFHFTVDIFCANVCCFCFTQRQADNRLLLVFLHSNLFCHFSQGCLWRHTSPGFPLFYFSLNAEGPKGSVWLQTER